VSPWSGASWTTRSWCRLSSDTFRCGAAARGRNDSLLGTAAPAQQWLLVENPGPWPRRAFEDSPVDPVAGRRIVTRARAAATRPLFIRRPGRRPVDTGTGHWAVVDAIAGTIGRHSGSLAQVAESAWTSSEPLADPLYLVCTHGRHDVCCAIAGRPVASAFADLRPTSTWECSHLGGDRFAGNVVVLPWGLTYGFVDADDVSDIVTATDRGEVFLPLLRGRSTEGPAVQAARITAMRELGVTAIDALTFESAENPEPGDWVVRFRRGATTVRVEVQQVRVSDQRATCAHSEPVSMRELRGGAVTVIDP
jgi:hypothetical protein